MVFLDFIDCVLAASLWYFIGPPAKSCVVLRLPTRGSATYHPCSHHMGLSQVESRRRVVFKPGSQTAKERQLDPDLLRSNDVELPSGDSRRARCEPQKPCPLTVEWSTAWSLFINEFIPVPRMILSHGLLLLPMLYPYLLRYPFEAN